MIEAGVFKARQLTDEQEVRGHTEHMGDAAGWVGQQIQRMLRIELTHDHQRRAQVKAGHRIQADPADVELRQVGQAFRTAGEFSLHRRVDRVEELRPIGDLCTLGASGGAGGVHQHPDIVEARSMPLAPCNAGSDGLLIGAVSAVALEQGHRDLAEALELSGLLAELCAVEQHARFRVIEDEFQLGHRQPPVKGQMNGPDAGRCKDDFVVVSGVMAQGGDSITWLHTGFTLQKTGECLDTPVHLRVGESPA